MTLVALVGVLTALLAVASGQHPSYADYDYQDVASVRQAAPAPPSRTAYTRAVQATPRYSAQVTQPRPTPVAILKQINRHNDDGSYTYGYEGGDGSFKIETKLPTGEVMGKYGYVDDTGKLRVIDYGANKYGFQPAGEGITVAPPTLVDETTAKSGRGSFVDYDDESAFSVQPQRPQRPSRVFAARPPAPARSYTGFEQEIRAVPTPSYDQVPVRFAPTPAPARFEPPARRPAPARFAPQPPQPVPQQIQQQIPQHIQQEFHQPIPQHVVQQQQASQAPVPPRAAIPNAVPVGPVYRVSPSPPPRPAPVREQFQSPAAGGSLLDQLLKQYALPSGVGQPLHDITFGSFSSRTNY